MAKLAPQNNTCRLEVCEVSVRILSCYTGSSENNIIWHWKTSFTLNHFINSNTTWFNAAGIGMSVLRDSWMLMCFWFRVWWGSVLGVQDLWAAWNSTPEPSTNLAGWHSATGSNTDYPCWNQQSNWQGVSCLRYTSNYTSYDSNTWIVGL